VRTHKRRRNERIKGKEKPAMNERGKRGNKMEASSPPFFHFNDSSSESVG
jgi:hypothetical protein